MEAGPGEFFHSSRVIIETDARVVCSQNLAFASHEAKFSMKKVQHKLTGGLGGREPTVETETNT